MTFKKKDVLSEIITPTYPPAKIKKAKKDITNKIVKVADSILLSNNSDISAKKLCYLKQSNNLINTLNVYNTCTDLYISRLNRNFILMIGAGILYLSMIYGYPIFSFNWFVAMFPFMYLVQLIRNNRRLLKDSNLTKCRISNSINNVQHFKTVTLNVVNGSGALSYESDQLVNDVGKISSRLDMSYLNEAEKNTVKIDDDIDMEFAKLEMENK
jgi:hypothetical protein